MDTLTRSRAYHPEQLILMAKDRRDWHPKGYKVYFIRGVVGELNLTSINRSNVSMGGQPPQDPPIKDQNKQC